MTSVVSTRALLGPLPASASSSMEAYTNNDSGSDKKNLLLKIYFVLNVHEQK